MQTAYECLNCYPEQKPTKNWLPRKSQQDPFNLDKRLFEKYNNRMLQIDTAIREYELKAPKYIDKIKDKINQKADNLTMLQSNVQQALWACEIIKEKIAIMEITLRQALITLPDEK